RVAHNRLSRNTQVARRLTAAWILAWPRAQPRAARAGRSPAQDVLNGRSPVRSGLRQLLLGGAAALVTFAIGHLIGAGVS
ncbi:MAG: hypothetical protein ACLQID_05015, partial [Streptosporangiaceae bacterium]